MGDWIFPVAGEELAKEKDATNFLFTPVQINGIQASSCCGLLISGL